MATVQQPAPPPPGPQKKGCSAIAVFMVAVLCLVVGFVAGAGGIYAYLAFVDDGIETLGLSAPAASAPTVVAAPAADQATEEPVYALVYPIEETLRIEGKIDPAAVRTKVTTERFQFQKCYQRELTKSRDLKGEVSLQFTVSGSNGKVIAAVSRQDTTGSAALTDCVLKEIKDWSFRPIEGSNLSVVRFDVLFLPISSASAAP